MTEHSPSIAALIVTYNRKALLARCVDAVLAQTRPADRVIIIDNCSTDGTPDFLKDNHYLDNPTLRYVRLPVNAGPGGGLYEGMRIAYEDRYDWIWTVDDDGVPLPDNLSSLSACPSRFLFRGSLIIRFDDPSGDDMVIALPAPRGDIFRVSELEKARTTSGLFEGYVNPWNGVLVSRKVISRVGLPKKEFFYRCVETEYFLRVKKAGIPVATVIAAKTLHGPDRQQYKKFCLGPLRFTLTCYDDPVASYFHIRNSAYTYLRHKGPFHKHFLKLLAYPFVFPGKTVLFSRAFFEGVAGRFYPPDKVRSIVARSG